MEEDFEIISDEEVFEKKENNENQKVKKIIKILLWLLFVVIISIIMYIIINNPSFITKITNSLKNY